MKLSDKQTLLSAFHKRETFIKTIHCNITGIFYAIEAPILPSIPGLCYDGLSPLASLASCLTLGKLSYNQGHAKLAPSVLAGAVLSLLYHYNIRKDKLSATEANAILSMLPLFVLSQALSFLASLSEHERKRIPFLSLSESNSDTLPVWLAMCHRALDISQYMPVEIKTPKLVAGKGILDQSILVETRKAARLLLQNLKTSGILPLKLQTIVQISIQKNNLALMGDALRNNIITALTTIASPDCLALADIFKQAGKNLTNQEAITKQQFESNFESASDSFPSKKPSLLEIIARKKIEASGKTDYASIVKELAAEESNAEGDDTSIKTSKDEERDEDKDREEEQYLSSDMTDDEILAEAGIEELDFSIEEQEEQEEEEQGKGEDNV